MDEGRVFIVDADHNNVGFLTTLLRQHGYEVGIATQADRAVAAAVDARPDVLLIDARLPGVGGLALWAELRASPALAEVPVVFMGEHDDAQARIDGFEAGATDYLARPFEAAEVVARVKRHVTVARVRTALKESEAKFRSVMESAVDAIISADGDGVIRSWNRAAEAIFGYAEAEVLGKPLEIIIPERFRAAHREGLGRVAAGGPSRVIGHTVEVAAVTRTGREIPVELSLATWMLDDRRYFTGILRDISQRKEAEEKFRSVTESAIDAIISAEHDGTIIGWNRAAAEIFGHTPEEAIGRNLEMIIPERFREAHRAGMKRVTEGGESRVIGQTVEVAGLRRGGAEIPIELSLSSWTVDGVRYYTGIVRDISKRKAAEEQLRRYNEELQRQHEALQRQHQALLRSQEALLAALRQNDRMFAAMTDRLNERVLNGAFRLDEKLASGGFGVVYRATQLSLQRPVAVKLLKPPPGEQSGKVFERFHREGFTACRIVHPNAVAVLDLGVSEDGLPYLVMELLDGDTVAERLRAEGPFPLGRALEVLADVCSVLDAAHRTGVIHRDIKPSNVFLHRPPATAGGGEVVKVLDFGIARLLDDPVRLSLTHTGELLGTPTYMAPERVSRGEESPRTDIYSVGVMLYEMLAGRLPIGGQSNVWSALWMQVTLAPDPLEEVLPWVPPALADLAARALAKQPEERPEAAEMEAALRALRADLSPEMAARRAPRPVSPAAAAETTPPGRMAEAQTLDAADGTAATTAVVGGSDGEA